MTNQQPNGQTTSLTQNSRTRQITLIGLMTAITCILAPLSIPLPFSPVPISLTNLVIFISVFLIYLLLGAVGLPVFASFHAGLSVLAGPTGGYLIGFIFLALIQGFAMKYFDRKLIPTITGMLIGMAVCYIFGTVWLAKLMSLSFKEGLFMGVIPYLPGDAVKIIIAVIVGPKLYAATKKVR